MESRSYTSFRKGRKLLAEKKRRNRINECLNQIKNLLTDDQHSTEMDLDGNKMEKAEILESAVEFIKKFKHSPVSSPRQNQVTYQTGFTRCAQEMMCFLNGVTEVSDNVKYRLLHHVTRNIQPNHSNMNSNYLQYPGLVNQNGYQQHYVKYNSSLAIPLDYGTMDCAATKNNDNTNNNNTNDNNNNIADNNTGSNNNDNSVWRPW